MQIRASENSIVKTLRQFGFVSAGESGNQIYGNCLFCEEPKFYVNEKTGLWDCKKCMRSGGFYTLLDQLAKTFADNLKPSGKARDLAAARDLKESTLYRNKVGYNYFNDTYIIPNFFFDNPSKVFNLAIYNGKKLLSTQGCKVGLYGWEHIKKSTDYVWLCEGVWDWLVMDEVLYSLHKTLHDVAVGAPGAGTFKVEWGEFFKDKMVNVLYDNDDAGKLGSFKVHNLLIHFSKSNRYISWLNKAEGYDVNDMYRDYASNPLKTLMGIRTFLQEAPPTIITKDGKKLEVKVKEKTEYTTDGVEPEEVYKMYHKWLHLPSTEVIDILYGAIIANRLDGDPIWMFFVAPSGGTKTEILLSVSAAKDIEVISSLTPRTLVSGMTLDGGMDASLLPKLDGKILIIKDFTGILSMNKIARDEILGDLRDAYDGEFSKPFGNATWRKYKSKFGILAGVTPEIENHLTDSVAMGERFLRYPIPIEGSIDARKGFIRRALSNVANETAMREELRSIANKVIDCAYNEIPSISVELQERIICAAHWICMMRGVVNRDRYSKQVLVSPYIEVGTRIAKQLCKIGYGIAMFRRMKEVGSYEYDIIKRVAMGSIPRDNEKIFRYMFHNQKEYTNTELGERLKLPEQLIDRICQDLRLTGILIKKSISIFKLSWSISPEVIVLVEESGLYE